MSLFTFSTGRVNELQDAACGQ